MKRKTRAFTLIETLLTLSILLIFTITTVVIYRAVIVRYELRAVIETLLDGLQDARMMAITQHTTLFMCPKSANRQCGNNWSLGQWIVNPRTQQCLRVLPAVPVGYRLVWRGSLGRNQAISWRSNGFTDGQQGSFLFFQGSDKPVGRIVVLRSGRLRSEIGS